MSELKKDSVERTLCIPGDMFDFAWADGIDKSRPTRVSDTSSQLIKRG